MKIYVVYHSESGHTKTLAEAIGTGAREDSEAIVRVSAIDEINPLELADANAIIMGSSGRFGMLSAPLKGFIEGLLPLWAEGKLAGKIGTAFCTISSVHGGMETTLLSILIPMLHFGMTVIGLPITAKGNALYGSLYGLGVSTNIEEHPEQDKLIQPEDVERAQELGRYVVQVTKRMFGSTTRKV